MSIVRKIIEREARGLQKMRRRFFHLHGGNWWRWPLVLFLRLPVQLASLALLGLANCVHEFADTIPGVVDRPSPPPQSKGTEHE